MNLDLRTMMVMIAALSLLFSGLLALVGLHADNIRGIRQWALGSLCIGLGLGFSYFQLEPPAHPWALIFGATLAITGAGFQFSGIALFRSGRYRNFVPWIPAGIAFCQTFWFTVLYPDIHARVIANSLLFFFINAACAHQLFVRTEQPLRTAYWFTASSFGILAVMFLFRAVIVYLSPPDSYGLYTQMPINPATFFIGSMTQMAIVFGFVLMVTYRLAADHQKLASTDALTGVMNRRSLEEEAKRLLAHSSRTGEKLAIMMVDVDYFKAINDRYGHQAGDEVLKQLTSIAQNTVRTSDYLARYGGEEFCILLPDSAEQDAWVLAERLRRAFASTSTELNGESISNTISVGIADSVHAGLEYDALVAAADNAMYRAKQEGRNRVVLYSVHAYT